MKRNLPQNVTIVSAVDPNTYATTTARVGNAIDRLGYDSAVFSLNYTIASAGTINTLTITMAEGPTSSPATAVTFNVTPDVPDSTAAKGIYNMHLDLRGLDRYIKFTVTPAATGGGTTTAAASLVLGDKNVGPVPSAVTVFKKA
jgi:hypothetical protein